MPSTFSGFGRAIKVKICVLENGQRIEVDDQFITAVTLLKDHTLQWWISKNAQGHEWMATLIWVGYNELFVVKLALKYQELY